MLSCGAHEPVKEWLLSDCQLLGERLLDLNQLIVDCKIKQIQIKSKKLNLQFGLRGPRCSLVSLYIFQSLECYFSDERIADVVTA